MEGVEVAHRFWAGDEGPASTATALPGEDEFAGMGIGHELLLREASEVRDGAHPNGRPWNAQVGSSHGVGRVLLQMPHTSGHRSYRQSPSHCGYVTGVGANPT